MLAPLLDIVAILYFRLAEKCEMSQRFSVLMNSKLLISLMRRFSSDSLDPYGITGGVAVATSNRHPENLYERGLNWSLFLLVIKEPQKRYEVWKMEGDQDYRMRTAGKEKGA